MGLSRKYDFRYGGTNLEITRTCNQTTLNGAQTLKYGGTNFLVVASDWRVGDYVKITDSVASITTYCVVAGVPDTTHLILVPVNTSLNTGEKDDGLNHEFPSGSVVTSSGVPQEVFVAVIDLTDAPDPTYNYVVAACCALQNPSSSSHQLDMWVSHNGKSTEPLDGTKFNHASITFPSYYGGDTQPYNWTGVSYHTLTSGRRHHLRIMMSGVVTTGHAMQAQFPRMVCLRVDSTTAYVAGTGSGGDWTASSSSEDPDDIEIPANTIADGSYLILGSWCAGHSATDTPGATPSAEKGRVQVGWKESGGATSAIARHDFNPFSSSDYLSSGFMHVGSVSGSSILKLEASFLSGALGQWRDQCLVALNIDHITSMNYYEDDSPSVTDPTDDTWTELFQSGSLDTSQGMVLEIISLACKATDEPWYIRPDFENAPSTYPGIHGYQPGGSDPYINTFFMHRSKHDGSSVQNSVDGKTANSTGTNFTVKLFQAINLIELQDLEVLPDTSRSIVAEVESSRFFRWNWELSGSSYKTPIADKKHEITNVRVINASGSIDYTEVSSSSDLAEKTWFFDTSSNELYVQYPSGEKPTDDDVYTEVTETAYLDRNAISVADGVDRPYESRLLSLGGSNQSLNSSNGKFRTTVSLGRLEIADGDNAYAELISERSVDGRRTRILQGYPDLSLNRDDFDLLIDSFSAVPKHSFTKEGSPLSVSIPLYDRSIQLGENLAATRVSVQSGPPDDAVQREDQLLYVVFGYEQRIPFYRITNNLGESSLNTYKGVSHPVKSVPAAYASRDDSTPISSSDIATGILNLLGGQIQVYNRAFKVVDTEYENNQVPEVIWCDVQGWWAFCEGDSQPLISAHPGEIAYLILTNYAGEAAHRVARSTFYDFDHKWRVRQVDGAPAPGWPLRMGIDVAEGVTMAEALDRLMSETFGYWYTNRAGRYALGVPNYDHGNLLENPGFERTIDGTIVPYPWMGSGLTINQSESANRVYEGKASWVIAGTSGTESYLYQKVVLPKPGLYALSAMGRPLLDQVSGSFALGLVTPSRQQTIEYFQKSLDGADGWTRISSTFDIASGDAGESEVRIFPAATGGGSAVTVFVDSVQLYPVWEKLDDTNARIKSYSIDPEIYWECWVSFDVNPSVGSQGQSGIDFTEARNISTQVQEGKWASESSRSLTFSRPHMYTALDAGGVARSLADYYGRPRIEVELEVVGITSIPVVGEFVWLEDDFNHVPRPKMASPIWMIRSVNFSGDNPNSVKIVVEQEFNTISDSEWRYTPL